MRFPQPPHRRKSNKRDTEGDLDQRTATEEHIVNGKASKEEKCRNEEADKLATRGIAMNEVDGIMVKATRQRKTVTALQQTKLVKM